MRKTGGYGILLLVFFCSACISRRLERQMWSGMFANAYPAHKKFVRMNICNKLNYMEKLVYKDSVPIAEHWDVEYPLIYAMALELTNRHGDSMTVSTDIHDKSPGFKNHRVFDADLVSLRRKYNCNKCRL